MLQLHQELAEADEGFKAGHMQGLLGRHEEEVRVQEQEELSRVIAERKLILYERADKLQIEEYLKVYCAVEITKRLHGMRLVIP
jgi:hypothetical protein